MISQMVYDNSLNKKIPPKLFRLVFHQFAIASLLNLLVAHTASLVNLVV